MRSRLALRASPPTPPSERELAYMAGIFDGEGSVGIYSNGHRNTVFLRLQVANTSLLLMEWLEERFGGSVYTRNVKDLYQQRYDWQMRSREAAVLLETLLPFVLIKKAQAEVALRLYSEGVMDNQHHGRGHPVPATELQRRRGLVEELKALKKGA